MLYRRKSVVDNEQHDARSIEDENEAQISETIYNHGFCCIQGQFQQIIEGIEVLIERSFTSHDGKILPPSGEKNRQNPL